MREATSLGHTHSLARRAEDPVPEPRQPSQPGALLGPLAAPRELLQTEPARRRRAAESPAPEPLSAARRAPGGGRRTRAPGEGGRGTRRLPARRGDSQRRRRREDTGASCRRSRVEASSPYRELGGQRRPGEGAPAAPALASSLRPGGRERATRQGPAAAAAPPSPALSAPPGAAAAAASSASAPPPAPRKSPPRTRAPGSEGGKTRDSPKTPRCGGLEEPRQSFLWIKKIYDFFFSWQKKRRGRPAGICKEKGEM